VANEAYAGYSRPGRWLAQRRIQIAAGIAVAEGLIVLFSDEWSKWTAIIIAIPIILFYIFAGRTLQSDAGRQLAWIAGASQAMAVVLVILAVVLKWLLILAVVALALLALVFLFGDRPGGRTAKQ
jgi:hypothetical protein